MNKKILVFFIDFKEDNHSGFTNEAKEWAGELLSGQTKVLLANN